MSEQSTQDFLEIQDIKEGILILKNGQMRGVLMVSSSNFALKSDEDQEVILYAYQNFLNSLDFNCQIVVQSRKINITPYLDKLKDLQAKQTNELLKIQTASYTTFIKDLVQGDSVMTKNFYVVVPYASSSILGNKTKANFLSLFGQKKNEAQNSAAGMDEEDFQKAKSQLWQRMEFLALGLRRCGLESIPLTTQEMIELFWSAHHLEEAEVGYSPKILPDLIK